MFHVIDCFSGPEPELGVLGLEEAAHPRDPRVRLHEVPGRQRPQELLRVGHLSMQDASPVLCHHRLSTRFF